MAKSRLSGGYCGNAVETAGNLEGSGASGRRGTKIAVSEDSRIPPRKCISLNSSCRSDAFGVPMEVLPLSELSAFQRKDLGNRLKSELEQVRLFQKKFEMQRTNGAVLSSSGDVFSSSNSHKRPKIEKLKKPSVSTSIPGNKMKPLSQTQKPPGLNRGSSGKFDSAAPISSPCAANALLMKDCESLLKLLMSHAYGYVFNTPVDVVKLNLPDYFSVIKHPMDLGTVKRKIAAGSYPGPLEFVDDVRLTFSNAMTYNPPGSDVYVMADTLRKYFEVRWKTIQKKLPRKDSLQLPLRSDNREDAKPTRPMLPSKKRKIVSSPPQPKVIPPPPAKQVMSNEEKHDLGRELESLLGEIPVHIIDFLKEHSSNGSECGEDEIEIDIDDLSDDTLFTLRKLLNDFLQEKQKNEAKVEVCEIELVNDSGPSNSLLQAFEGSDPANEEIDIGRIEPPLSSNPPEEIEKDTAYRMNKCLRPGSNESVNGLDKVGDKSQQKPRLYNSVCSQDGQCRPTERQVSPDKLYRAALLKNRFADTILKAREKTLIQGEKGDTEKLREKLEMEQRKEKARLQAEAKAAENARKQAEAEAAAEARQKRELEREAARQALVQMEKTVEINENSRFLEDLELLRAVPAEPLPSSADETSPDHSLDCLGSFKFGGSNPLEQLGLYMKVDDEEEEGEPPSVPNLMSDVEEGEID